MSLPEFIRNNLDAVVEEWQEFALTLSSVSQQRTSLVLTNHARSILLAIAVDVETAQSAEESILKSQGHAVPALVVAETAANAYGALRQQAGFDIAQMAAEYRALRSSVLRSWRQVRIARATDEMMATRFHEAIDEALAESIARYTAEIERGQNLFIGMIGHDIRTPLAAIAMSAEILRRAVPIDNRALQSVERIKRSTSTIDAMVVDLLKFARITLTADMPIHRVESDMNEICTLAIDDVAAAHPAATIELDTLGAAPGRWDTHRMGQVMRNLLSNAISYGEPGRGITVRLRSQPQLTSLTVENHGAVIPPEALGKIFEPLVRGPEVQSRSAASGKNLGLGLYIVREIVSAHGGMVWAESNDGRTAFQVALPIQPPLETLLARL